MKNPEKQTADHTHHKHTEHGSTRKSPILLSLVTLISCFSCTQPAANTPKTPTSTQMPTLTSDDVAAATAAMGAIGAPTPDTIASMVPQDATGNNTTLSQSNSGTNWWVPIATLLGIGIVSAGVFWFFRRVPNEGLSQSQLSELESNIQNAIQNGPGSWQALNDRDWSSAVASKFYSKADEAVWQVLAKRYSSALGDSGQGAIFEYPGGSVDMLEQFNQELAAMQLLDAWSKAARLSGVKPDMAEVQSSLFDDWNNFYAMVKLQAFNQSPPIGDGIRDLTREELDTLLKYRLLTSGSLGKLKGALALMKSLTNANPLAVPL